MPTNNDIRKLLGIEDANLLGVEEVDGTVIINLEKERQETCCPNCQITTDKVHDYRRQDVKDIPSFGRNVILRIRKRRYRCPLCGKCFFEKYSFLPKYHRMTKRLSAWVIDQLRECVTYTQVSKQANLSVTTVIRIFDIVSYPSPLSTPEIVGIDEFKGNLGLEKYQTILTDQLSHRVLDILPSRSKYTLSQYLSKIERGNTSLTISDMSHCFADVLTTFFPQSQHCADKYHVTRQVVWAFEAVRKQEQKRFSAQYRKYFKRSKYLLTAPFEKLSEERQQQVNIMLYASADLCSAHFLKEQFFALRKLSDEKAFALSLKRWIQNASCSSIPNFRDCASTFTRWYKSICNAWKTGATNGFTEGCNNKIKVLKRISYGLHNFRRSRNRILHIFS